MRRWGLGFASVLAACTAADVAPPAQTDGEAPGGGSTVSSESEGGTGGTMGSTVGSEATSDASSNGGDPTAASTGSSTGVEGPPMVDTGIPGELPCSPAALEYLPPLDISGPNDVDAFWMMWMSWWALRSEEPATEALFLTLGFDHYFTIDAPAAGLQAIVAGGPDRVVVAFRGSQEIVDWVTNLDFALIDAPGPQPGRAHRGFSRALDTAWMDLEAAIVSAGGTDRPIWITGQSLGGALAIQAAARLQGAGYTLAPVYAFANPRVGDTAFVTSIHAALQGRIHRYVNERDLVPRVPPWGGAAEEAGGVLPLGGGVAASLLASLDYASPGVMHHFRDGQWEDRPPLDDSEDVEFWTEASGQGWFVLLDTLQQGTWHDRDTYLCLMRAKAFGL